jgi:hypothetical protein
MGSEAAGLTAELLTLCRKLRIHTWPHGKMATFICGNLTRGRGIREESMQEGEIGEPARWPNLASEISGMARSLF